MNNVSEEMKRVGYALTAQRARYDVRKVIE